MSSELSLLETAETKLKRAGTFDLYLGLHDKREHDKKTDSDDKLNHV